MSTKVLADYSLDSVTIYRSSARLDGDADAKVSKRIRYAEEYASAGAKDLVLLEETAVLPRIVETSGRRECALTWIQRRKNYLPATEATRRLRPLARRRARTFLPLAVAMRARKP
jgi:hypothetical protein